MELLPLQWDFPNLLPYSDLERTLVKPDLENFLQNISLVFFNLLRSKDSSYRLMYTKAQEKTKWILVIRKDPRRGSCGGSYSLKTDYLSQ